VVARFLRKPSVSPRASARREPHQREKMAAVPMDPQQMIMLTGAVTSLESALLANKSDPRYARRKVGANLAPQGGTNGRTDRRPASKGCCWLSWMDGRGRGCGKGKWGGPCCSTARWRPVEKACREHRKKAQLEAGEDRTALGASAAPPPPLPPCCRCCQFGVLRCDSLLSERVCTCRRSWMI
jgi:hypothetical protein